MNISVIVPFYNAEPYIERCVEGLFGQDYPREQFEILMIDNNSTDQSAAIVRRYPGIRLLHERKQGAYAARNRGLAEARGDMIAFTDPDCVARHDFLRRIDAGFEPQEVKILLGRSLLGCEDLPLSLLSDYEHSKEEFVFGGDSPELYYGHTNNMAVRKELFEELGPFIERARGADTIFVRRGVDRLSCRAVQYAPDVVVRHLEIESVRTYFRKMFTYGRSRRLYSRLVAARPLGNRQRWQVFTSTVRRHEYSPVRAGLLLLLLGIGVIAWNCGSWSALIEQSVGER